MISDKKYKFIIIDDHPLIRDGIIHFIKAHENFEFAGEFSDVREVLNSSPATIPDVIILDLNLGGVDGSKYCPMLKQRFSQCKIVAFTHYEGREKELQDLGFDGYLVKSEKESLIEALLTVLQGNKYFKVIDAAAKYSSEHQEMDSFLKMKQLTAREIEIAKYIIQGYSNKEIGQKIYISESTVETHRKHIKEKLKPKNNQEFYSMLRNYNS